MNPQQPPNAPCCPNWTLILAGMNWEERAAAIRDNYAGCYRPGFLSAPSPVLAIPIRFWWPEEHSRPLDIHRLRHLANREHIQPPKSRLQQGITTPSEAQIKERCHEIAGLCSTIPPWMEGPQPPIRLADHAKARVYRSIALGDGPRGKGTYGQRLDILYQLLSAPDAYH